MSVLEQTEKRTFNEGKDPSEDLRFLLAKGKIEELVRQGRAPFKIGEIDSPGEEMQPYYQVPPRGCEPQGHRV